MSPPPSACPADLAPLRPQVMWNWRRPPWPRLSWPPLLAWAACVLLALVVVAGSGRPLAWAWLLTVLAPLGEELLLRGVVQESLLRRWACVAAPAWRCVAINLLVALMLAILHAQVGRLVLAPVAALPVALFIGWWYQARRRLTEAMALHAFFNLFWLVVAPWLMLLLHPGPPR